MISIDLPVGMRTWIWENIQDVVPALRYLMTDEEMLDTLATLGKLTEAMDKGKMLTETESAQISEG